MPPDPAEDWSSLFEAALDTEYLPEAAALLRGALSLAPEPLFAAETRQELGSVLTDLGSQRRDAAVLAEAIALLREARTAYAGLDDLWHEAWAARDLAEALALLGFHGGGLRLVREAADILRETLDALPAEDPPFDPDAATLRLAFFLNVTGGRDPGVSREVITLLRPLVARRPEHPDARMKLASALSALGRHTGDTALLDEAVTLLRAALEAAGTDPGRASGLRNNLALALGDLGALLPGTALMEEAVALLRPLAEEHRRDGNDVAATATAANLSRALRSLSERQAAAKPPPTSAAMMTGVTGRKKPN